jgi:hypothetical protein
MALHHHWHPECSLVYYAVAVKPSNTSFHPTTTANLATVRLPDHGEMPSLFAFSNGHASDVFFNADGDQDNIVGDDAEGLVVNDEKDLHDVFSFPQAYHGAKI